MPPKPNKTYPNGLEHIGIVIGDNLDEFADKYRKFITGQQDQGQYCKPYFIRFADGTRIKFYKYSLKKVVELEGNKFINI